MKIAFDVQGTLIRSNKDESIVMVEFLKILKKAGHYIIVWSGDDVERTKSIIKQLGIEEFVDFVTSKLNTKDYSDVAFDDNEFAFSRKATIKV